MVKNIKKNKTKAQVILEMCLVFCMMILLSVVLVRIWRWAVVPIFQRQTNYGMTRIVAGVPGPPVPINTPVIWPVYHHRPLDRNEVFGNH